MGLCPGEWTGSALFFFFRVFLSIVLPPPLLTVYSQICPHLCTVRAVLVHAYQKPKTQVGVYSTGAVSVFFAPRPGTSQSAFNMARSHQKYIPTHATYLRP